MIVDDKPACMHCDHCSFDDYGIYCGRVDTFKQCNGSDVITEEVYASVEAMSWCQLKEADLTITLIK